VSAVYRNIPPADNPQFNVGANASWPNRVHFSIGTGMPSYNITPERAEELAQQLIDAARDTRGAG
jgi:DNA-binding IclR family transcriptional regulator